jgi:adenylylsulfate kinase|tara:strand:- start:879 stop:1313 length:435 start_codon:yes stop_codon:yes gene_type:complete
MKILIFGLPGSGKTTLAKPFAELIDAVHINADEVRTHYDDWDFSLEGRMRQANRMRHLSDGAVRAGRIVVTDFVCPTEEARLAFAPDYTVWMDTIKEGRFADTNKMFEAPTKYNYHVSEWFTDTHLVLKDVLVGYQNRVKNVSK